jgi:signal transduction histidine kinase
VPTNSVTGVPRPARRGLSLRLLLILGFAAIFFLWLSSAFALAQRMAEADQHGAEIRARFLRNDRLLYTISTLTLKSSVDFRDAILEVAPLDSSSVDAEFTRIHDEVERALDEYEPRDDSDAEGAQWYQLQNELRAYWESMMSGRAPNRQASIAELRVILNTEVIPKRQAIIRILDQIHGLNESGFQQEQSELLQVRGGLRRQVWQTTATAGLLGLAVAVLAIRQGGRLERRIREQHATELQQKHELERLSSQLLVVQEEERRRIARELHDEVGQALGAIKLELAVVEGRLGPGRAAAELAEARSITDRALQSVRELSQLLHPAMLDDLGLPDTARWYLQGFSRRTGIRTELDIASQAGRLRPEVEVCLYRVIQEAVTNVGRHAGATTCKVTMVRFTDKVQLTIEDDGAGFDPAEQGDARGLGLVSLRERVTGLGGQLTVDAAAGRGTRVVAELPLSVSAL